MLHPNSGYFDFKSAWASVGLQVSVQVCSFHGVVPLEPVGLSGALQVWWLAASLAWWPGG